jgi:hypothetical protein
MVARAPGLTAVLCLLVIAPIFAADAPAARIHGTLKTDTREQWRECVVTFHLSAGDGEAKTASCHVDAQGAWYADVPADVALDLKLQVRGFAPVYWFGTISRSNADNDLGTQRLQRGGSVSGYVRAPSGQPVEGAEVTAFPVAPGGEDVAVRSLRAKSDAHGFFQIAGAAYGTWHLQSKRAGLTTADGGLIDIKQDEETTLARPIVHLDLQSLDVYITPPVDRAGNPWHVTLDRRLTPTSRVSKTVAAGDGGTNGFWSAEKLEAGEYELAVGANDGGIRKRQTVRLERGTEVVPILMDDIAVRGKVTSGSTPVIARIVFSDDDGASVAAETDDDGEYTLSLPHEGVWHVELANGKTRLKLFRLLRAEVKRRDAEEFARVDIELPDGRVSGTVVDASGKPAEAIVVVRRESGDMLAQIFAEGGTFEIAGLPRGSAQIDARTPDTRSELLSIDIGAKTEVELTLRRQENVRGLVVTREGYPVAGAIVRALSSGFSSVESAVTGSSGRFEMSLPSTKAPITFLLLAPRSPIRMMQVPAGYSFAEPIRIVAAPVGGRLRVKFHGAPPWPTIRTSGDPVPLVFLLYPPDASGFPGGLTKEGFIADVEPGEYTVCAPMPFPVCGTQRVIPSGDALIDVTPHHQEKQQ